MNKKTIIIEEPQLRDCSLQIRAWHGLVAIASLSWLGVVGGWMAQVLVRGAWIMERRTSR